MHVYTFLTVPEIQVEQQAPSAKVQNDKHIPNITYHNFSGQGHYKSDCPSSPMDTVGATNANSVKEELDGDLWAFQQAQTLCQLKECVDILYIQQ